MVFLMNKFRELVGGGECHAFVVCVGELLFSFPLLIMSNTERPAGVYLSLFVPWGIMIGLLFVISRSYVIADAEEGSAEEDGELNDV